MISRMLFVALEDHISVISVSERGKSNPIPFDGDVVFKIRDDFWDSWKEQTAFISMSSVEVESGAPVDFCFICDKEYSFYSDEFLEKVRHLENGENSIWNVGKIIEVMHGQSILGNYQALNVKLKNDVSFTVEGSKDKEQAVISAWTNIADDAYKEMLEEKERKEEQKRAEKLRALAEKKVRELGKQESERSNEVKEADKAKVAFSDIKAVKNVKRKQGKTKEEKTKEETAFTRYNRILREKDEANQ